MARKTLNGRNGSTIHVGEGVEFPWGISRKGGVVVEDRGPLDVDGGQIVRIQHFEKTDKGEVFEAGETETAAKSVTFIHYFDFAASEGSVLFLRVSKFFDEESVLGHVIPAESRQKFAPWHHGKPISWFSPSAMIIATPTNPEGRLALSGTGHWVGRIITNANFTLILHAVTGEERTLTQVPFARFFDAISG